MTTEPELREQRYRYERSFTVPFDVERAWAMFVDPAETSAWLLPVTEADDGTLEAHPGGLPSFEITVEQFDPPEHLQILQTGANIPGVGRMNVEFTAAEGGTHINLERTGYGDPADWRAFGPLDALGWDEALTDLMLYAATGVRAPRHVQDARSTIAATTVQRDFGIELTDVFAGGFADQAGANPGDVLLELDGVPVYRLADVWTITRLRRAGDEVAVTLARSGEVHRGSAPLSAFDLFGDRIQ